MAALTPLEMLNLSDTEQMVVQCLTRKPQQTATELASAIKLSSDELAQILEQMVRAARLVREIYEGQPRFSVRFALDRQAPRSKASSLLDLFD